MLENYLVPHLGQGTWMLYCMVSIVELILVEPYP